VNRDFVEPELVDLIRNSNIILLMVDLLTEPVQQLEDTVAFLKERRIVPSHLQEQYTGDRRPTFIPLLVLANKCDDQECDEVFEIFCELLEEEWPLLPVSVSNGRNLDLLKQAVFEQLSIVRVYSRPPGEEPDLSAPFILESGSSVEDFAGKVHQDFLRNLKSARVWGHGVYDGQMVGRDHVLHDGDVVELRI
jgi:ribosome-interacting GTPase 1